MAIADRHGLPIGLSVGRASPHEVTLVEETLDSCYPKGKPEKVIADKAYDSDQLDEKLQKERGIELIAPHKCNRKKSKTQDRRKLRRYKRRWKIERLSAWPHNYRKITARYDFKLRIILGLRAWVHSDIKSAFLRCFYICNGVR